MTPQQREQLNRFLAERVLGWQFNQPPPKGFFCRSAPTMDAPVWIKKPDGWQCGLCDSIPDFTQWADCEPLIDKIEQDGWNVQVYFDATGEKHCLLHKYSGDRMGEVWQAKSMTSRTEPICLAIARAYNYQGGDNASS